MKLKSFFEKHVGHASKRRRAWRALRCLSDRTASIGAGDVLLFCCLRNEMDRLPYFCAYYRSLGVNHFLFIDNGSTDDFARWAKPQGDISVWYTEESYKDANFGMEWCNSLLSKYGTGHLCVTVDPDEFLVYPFCTTRSLPQLGQHLRDSRKDTMSALMLDMYSDTPLREAHLAEGQSPLTACPFFDRDGYIQNKSYHQGIFVQGGPRMRVHNRETPSLAPALNKLPVVWWQKQYRYESSMHNLTPRHLNRPNSKAAISTTGCLLHFKFVASLAGKIDEEKARKQHYGNSREYEKYGEKSDHILYDPDISLRYEGPEQLMALGLMTRGDWF